MLPPIGQCHSGGSLFHHISQYASGYPFRTMLQHRKREGEAVFLGKLQRTHVPTFLRSRHHTAIEIPKLACNDRNKGGTKTRGRNLYLGCLCHACFSFGCYAMEQHN